MLAPASLIRGMSAPTQGHTASQILSELSIGLSAASAGAAWLPLGDALARLDEIGPQSQDGRPWVEVLREYHNASGHGDVSTGHLQKVRRVRNFVRDTLDMMEVSFPEGDIAAAQVSALEVASRFYALDPERGQKMLLECIRNGRTFADVSREYQNYVQQNPEQLPQKRATWLRKRQSNQGASADSQLVEKIIIENPARFLGGMTGVLKPFDPGKMSPFVRSTDFGFHIKSTDGDRSLGIEMIADEAQIKRLPGRILAQLDFQSTFFDMYWVFMRTSRPCADELASMLKAVRLERIGLLWFDNEDGYQVLRDPDCRVPSLDRRDLLKI